MLLSRLHSKAKLDISLVALAALCLWIMLSASSDPVFFWLRNTHIAKLFYQFSNGNQVASDLSISTASAIGMFYLLVRFPEHERKRRIQNYLRFSYHSFKRSVIQIFVSTIQKSYDTETINQLMDQKNFREFFKSTDPTTQQNKWDNVANKMSDVMLRQLILEAEVLQNELQHILSIVDIRDPKIYAFMKNFSETLYRAKNWSADYDEKKEFLRFFWSVLSGWSFNDGYAERDYIAEMIEKL